MNLHDAEKFSSQVAQDFDSLCNSATKQEIEDANGKIEPNIISNTGSLLYVAYENTTPLYVGETGKSIKRRFISDTSGSHKVKNSDWYARMTHVKFIDLDEDNVPYRKLLEQALSIAIQPEFYGRRDKK
ncbi:MAG: hypothetical protein GQ582_05665 [Methyloprofundus sp.]|nr:hypothetical protein [Methyloprofundus sp.]